VPAACRCWISPGRHRAWAGRSQGPDLTPTQGARAKSPPRLTPRRPSAESSVLRGGIFVFLGMRARRSGRAMTRLGRRSGRRIGRGDKGPGAAMAIRIFSVMVLGLTGGRSHRGTQSRARSTSRGAHWRRPQKRQSGDEQIGRAPRHTAKASHPTGRCLPGIRHRNSRRRAFPAPARLLDQDDLADTGGGKHRAHQGTGRALAPTTRTRAFGEFRLHANSPMRSFWRTSP